MPLNDQERNYNRPRRLVVSINTSWNIVNFRWGLVQALRGQGFEVIALSPDDGYSARLADMGCRHVPLPMDNKGTNPFGDAILFLLYLRLLRREKPDVFLGWTIKPNVYGSLAARLLGIPTINNVSGLGTAFIRDGWLTRIVKLLYWAAFNGSTRVFFQNRDDLALFADSGLVREEQARLLPGSGIDLERFSPSRPLPQRTASETVFLLVARLLWDKGIGEYVEAARKLRARLPQARFQLLGFLDVENRTAVPRQNVDEWTREGVIEYLGHADDVRPYIAAADCVVLPSYREGTPRSLLEAAAMAKPLVTTNTPGCRDVVEDGINGWLCKPMDADDLAATMLRFAQAPEEVRMEMGRQSRLKVKREFSESIVIDRYLEAIDHAIAAVTSNGPIEWKIGPK